MLTPNQPTPLTNQPVPQPISPTGATAMPQNATQTGTTGVTGVGQSQLQPQQVNNVQPTTDSINLIMLCYAISAYAYSYAFLDTVKNIQTTADGNGIFQTVPVDLFGVSIEEIAKGKEIATSSATQSNTEQIAEAAAEIVNNPEALAKTGMTADEFYDSLGLEAPAAPEVQAPQT